MSQRKYLLNIKNTQTGASFRGFHRFGQAKIANGGLILGSR